MLSSDEETNCDFIEAGAFSITVIHWGTAFCA